mgnify:CR=1 FL=1
MDAQRIGRIKAIAVLGGSRVLLVAALLAAIAAGCDGADLYAGPCGGTREARCVGDLDQGAAPAEPVDEVAPPCRPAVTGELPVNEVLQRPGGLDFDGDGASTTRDEMVEWIVDSSAPAHLLGAELWFDGERRGVVRSSPCLRMGQAVVLVGHLTAPWSPPQGAVLVTLDRTLRLSDKGGHLALIGLGGGELGFADLPAAPAKEACSLVRARDGDRAAPLEPHCDHPDSKGAPWSPGLCTDGGRFPGCLTIGAAVSARPPAAPALP